MISFKKNLALVLLFSVLLLVCVIAQYSMENYIIMPGFYYLEKKYATEKMSSIVAAIEREAYHMARLSADWAAWDDMYQYVHDGNSEFARSNFQWESLLSSGIDLIFVVDTRGRIVWKGIKDPETGSDRELSIFPEDVFDENHYFMKLFRQKEAVSGLVKSEHGPIFVSIRPILTSANTGPSRGMLIMGRFFSRDIVSDLQRQTNTSFSMRPLSEPSEEATSGVLDELSHQQFVFRPSGADRLEGFTMISDIEGRPTWLLTAFFNRDIVFQGRATAVLTSYVFVSVFLVMGALSLLWFVLFKRESQRRQMEISRLVDERTRRLRESEERLRTLINATPDIICFKDAEGRWIEANESDLELFDLKGIDYRGKKDSELAEYTHPKFKKAFMECENTDELAWKKRTLSRSEERIETVDGSVRIFDVIKVPIFNEDGSRKGLIVFGRDVTQEKLLQDRLKKAEKMQAIGLMAGGVAHDLNNILSGILAYPDLLLLKLPEDSELRRPIEAIKEAGRRASRVVADLLTIARGVAAPKEPANVNDLVKEYIKSPEFLKLSQNYPEVQLELDLGDDLCNIVCSRVHVKKCIMNLVTNAFEAIDGKGIVTISTANLQVKETSIENEGYLKPGRYVLVEVRDSGAGISDTDIDRVFEPFYTKKMMGRSGTGLGLAIVWNTVHDHGGAVDVRSDHTGTAFSLYFPATDREASSDEKEEDSVELSGNGARILVVDDEAPQRELLRSLLEEMGYVVDTVASGEEAMELLKTSQVDVVILDMMLGSGMNGRHTYQELVKISPGLKALIVSGFCEEREVEIAQRLGAGQFIRKPYTLKTLGEALKKLLDS